MQFLMRDGSEGAPRLGREGLGEIQAKGFVEYVSDGVGQEVGSVGMGVGMVAW
jgi:hypothetical protein